MAYHANPKYKDRQARGNIIDQDQTRQNMASDHGVYCLPHIQQSLDTITYQKAAK